MNGRRTDVGRYEEGRALIIPELSSEGVLFTLGMPHLPKFTSSSLLNTLTDSHLSSESKLCPRPLRFKEKRAGSALFLDHTSRSSHPCRVFSASQHQLQTYFSLLTVLQPTSLLARAIRDCAANPCVHRFSCVKTHLSTRSVSWPRVPILHVEVSFCQ